MNLTIFARERHHKVHAKAIADRLGLDVIDNARNITTDNVCVFCYGDLKLVNKLNKKIIFCEHGVGMYYENKHPSYAGSLEGRDNVILRLSPNESHARKEMETLKCPVEIVGVPKLDKYVGKHWRVKKYRPTVAISFHWDCLVNPETRSSFKFFLKGLPELAKNYNLIGHGHPRIMKTLIPYYRRYGIRVVETFDEVIKRADVYICDNSSTIFEWLITRKPIVLLNPPFYRKNITHVGNPRFWKHASIGPLVESPQDLTRAVGEAIFSDLYKEKIEEAIKDVLTFDDGKCTDRAVKAITRHLKITEDIKPKNIFSNFINKILGS